MKVIFLDFDGVINSFRTAIVHNVFPVELPEDTHLFDPVAIRMIRRLFMLDDDIKVVVSSTWRLHEPIDELSKLLGFQVYSVTPDIIPATGMYESNNNIPMRGEQIEDWLYRASHKGVKVTHYCIIDDDVDDMLEQQRPHIVQTSMMNGFLTEHYLKVLEILELEDEFFPNPKQFQDDTKLPELDD